MLCSSAMPMCVPMQGGRLLPMGCMHAACSHSISSTVRSSQTTRPPCFKGQSDTLSGVLMHDLTVKLSAGQSLAV